DILMEQKRKIMYGITKNTEAAIITKNLFSLLDEVTDPDVVIFDKEIRDSKDKHSIFAEFETTPNKKNKRAPSLLERWTHYSWIRLELSYLAKQKAALNKIHANQNALDLDSVNAAIYEAKSKHVSIKKSIKTL